MRNERVVTRAWVGPSVGRGHGELRGRPRFRIHAKPLLVPFRAPRPPKRPPSMAASSGSPPARTRASARKLHAPPPPPCPRPTAAAALSRHGGLGVASLRSLSPVDRRRYHERAGRWPGGAPRRRRLVVRMACAAWIRWDCSSRYVSPSVRCDRLTFSSFQHEALGIALSFPSRARAAMVGNLSTTYACVVVSW